MEGLGEVSIRSAGGDGGGVLGYWGSQSLRGRRCPPGLERHGGRGVDWCRQLSCVCFGALGQGQNHQAGAGDGVLGSAYAGVQGTKDTGK